MDAIRQQDHQEDLTRKAGDFDAMELSMPTLPRVPFVRSVILDNIYSAITPYVPWSQQYDPSVNYLWLLDNTAHRDPTQPKIWTAEFVAAIFHKDSVRKELGRVVADIAEKVGLADDEEAEKTIARRIQPFVDSTAKSTRVSVSFGEDRKQVLRLKKSNGDGISCMELRLPKPIQAKDGDVITSSAYSSRDGPEVKMSTLFVEPEGWAVISDIDDTIKRTLTSSPLGIIKETFVEEPSPVVSMPDLYKHIYSTLSHPPFYYLSASPYNLYPFLHSFIRQYYPPGSLHLREASWMNLAGFLSSLTKGTLTYKVDRVKNIHRWLPQRKMVCIGDSTQTDPEAYAEVYRQYPGWVKKIYIRKVMDVAEMIGTDKNTDGRFEEAFKNVPRDVWQTFEDPTEIFASVESLVK
ncbi:MAG: hypothetical protein M1825_005285 [Sarcosagium campestre]|nr:MAG: hypothetical protein M1825_005285 [Sarcosagium campestre]